MPRNSKSRFLTTRYAETGTRFLISPQPEQVNGFEPETVYLKAAPGTIRAGPQDEGLYVVDAEAKVPYEDSGDWPPYTGPRRPAARPDAEGHFDHILPEDDTFSSATVFATIRLVLTIWEQYLGRKIRWYFRDAYPRLEVIPRVLVDGNAISKFGYIECGFASLKRRSGPFCQHFDVVAHEVGHMILKDVIGNPSYRTLEFRSHEEAAADLVAMVALLHFESVVKHLFAETHGNLYSSNVLSRTVELSRTKQLRKLFNHKTMANLRWDPDPDYYKYELAAPFSGGAYDIFVEIYEQDLVRRGAIPKTLAEDSFHIAGEENEDLQPRFRKHLQKREAQFEGALLHARDAFARLLARTWANTSMQDLTYPRVVENMIEADLELHRGRHIPIIQDSFVWREIVPGTAE